MKPFDLSRVPCGIKSLQRIRLCKNVGYNDCCFSANILSSIRPTLQGLFSLEMWNSKFIFKGLLPLPFGWSYHLCIRILLSIIQQFEQLLDDISLKVRDDFTLICFLSRF